MVGIYKYRGDRALEKVRRILEDLLGLIFLKNFGVLGKSPRLARILRLVRRGIQETFPT